MATVRMYDDRTQQEREVEVPAEVCSEILDMVFRDAVWRAMIAGDTIPEVVERLRMRHRRWFQRMREAMAAPTDPEEVFDRAAELRASGKSWRETAAATGVSVTTLRRRLEARVA